MLSGMATPRPVDVKFCAKPCCSCLMALPGLKIGPSTSRRAIYAQRGHGFGMKKQGLPGDHWIDRFSEWLQSQGFPIL